MARHSVLWPCSIFDVAARLVPVKPLSMRPSGPEPILNMLVRLVSGTTYPCHQKEMHKPAATACSVSSHR